MSTNTDQSTNVNAKSKTNVNSNIDVSSNTDLSSYTDESSTHIAALKQMLIQFIGVYYCFFFNRTEALRLLTLVRLTLPLFAHRAADCDPSAC